MKRSLAHRILKRVDDCAGTNMLEAAIVAPLLLLFTFAIVDFASIFYVYLALENGVSQASRYGVTGQRMTDPVTGLPMNRADSIKTAMRNATPTLTIPDSAFSFSNKPRGGGSWSAGPGGPNSLEKVTVTYTWNVMTPLVRRFFTNGQVTFVVDSVMKNESF